MVAKIRSVEVWRHAGYYSVYVNDQRLVNRESYQVAHNIAHFVEHIEDCDNSESAEVARAIHDWLEAQNPLTSR